VVSRHTRADTRSRFLAAMLWAGWWGQGNRSIPPVLASRIFSNLYSDSVTWGGWGSNPRPADYEKSGSAHRTHCLHGYHGAVPPMPRLHWLHRWLGPRTGPRPAMAITGCQLQNVTVGKGLNKPGLRQAGDMVDLDYPPFFIDREEDAVAPGPQAPQIRRPVRERLRRPRLIGEPPARVRPVCFKGATGRPLVRP
jgi:hypothetical protein